MLAVPDNPDLKTFSSRGPRTLVSGSVNYQSSVGVLGPNIPFRLLEEGKVMYTAATTTVQSSPNKIFSPHDHPRSSNQTEGTPKLSTDSSRINNNTSVTGSTLASPLNQRVVKASRSDGYEEGAFVTIIAPSAVSNKSEKMTAGYGAGKLDVRQRMGDGGSEITTWPKVEW